MTSTLAGERGQSFGWVNRRFIAAGQDDPAFNNYGGEDRFWLGPEGGQFALWFRKGEAFDLGHWKTPAGFNTGCFELTSQGPRSAAMARQFEVTNYTGTKFSCAVKRVVSLLGPSQAAEHLGIPIPPAVRWVGLESDNTLVNAGRADWTRDGGLLSIWILGQFKPLPHGKVIVPFVPGAEAQLGPKATTNYFGEIPPERCRIGEDHLRFTCDGAFRSKLGISPARAKNVLGSFDPDANLLTIVQFNLPADAASLPYVNSLWELQDRPFAGDVINSYNDGEATPGAGQMGPFYEIETSSPAAELVPGEAIRHVHRTFHLTGPFEVLNNLAGRVLTVNLEQI
jgi:hypothetical protein